MSETNKEHTDDPYAVPLLIGGIDIVSRTTFGIRDPITRRVLHRSGSAAASDASHAFKSAQVAVLTWPKLKPAARRNYLLKAASIMEQCKESHMGSSWELFHGTYN